MRHIILTTVMAFIAGLFAAGQGIGAGAEYGKSSPSSVSSGAQMEESQKMAAHSLDNSQVRELQKLLNEKGFNSGAVDGIIGPITRNALREFQKSEGLDVTGTPDRATLTALATDARTQEIFGISPEFGVEKERGMEAVPEGSREPHEGVKTPEGTRSY